MRRRDFLCAGLVVAWLPGDAVAAAYDRGLLWRIERRGVAPSFLFGTLHQRDPRLLPLPAPVEEVFGRCRTCVIELFPDEAVAARFSDAARLPAGESLERLLSPSLFAALAGHLAAGLDPATVARLKPWAALLLLTSLPGDGANSLDNEIFIRARYASMRIEELDSVEEQIAVFDSIPLASQLALLEAAIEFHDELPALAEASVAAWLTRDLAALQRLGQRLVARRPTLAAHQRLLEQKVVHDRSVVMAYRMQGYLRRGGAFIAVGAAHLHGPAALQSLLVGEYGWRVSRVW